MYATSDDMVGRFGEELVLALAYLPSDPSQIDADKVAAALTDASDFMDSYISTKHAIPLSTVPSVLKRICTDVARYLLYRDVKPDDVKKSYDDAVSFLKGIASGTVTLKNSETGKLPTQGDAVVYHGSTRHDMSRHKLGGY